jgi:hypothetical protein
MTHYVYTHTSLKTGKVFYVGKGQRRRAYNVSSRNRHWKSIAESHGYSVEIVREFSNKYCAFTFEKIMIKAMSGHGLTNVSPGGEGGIGAKSGRENPMFGRTGPAHHRFGKKFTDKERAAISAGRKTGKKQFLSETVIEATRTRMIGNRFSVGVKHSNDFKKKISETFSGEGHPSYKWDEYTFTHNDGRIFTGTMHNFCASYDLLKGNVCWMIKGKHQSVKGWRLPA